MSSAIDYPARFSAALPIDDYIAATTKHRELWEAVRRNARVEPEILARVSAIPGPMRLLVLSEDWCGDAVNTVPVVARLAELAPSLELRVLARDANPDIMDAHLSPTEARAIPVVIALDAAYRELGWWGSRPAELQEWVMGPGRALPKDERYREVRRWYARDRGRTALRELVELLERAATPPAGRPT